MQQLMKLIVGACAILGGTSAFASEAAASAPSPACAARCSSTAAPAAGEHVRSPRSTTVAMASESSDTGNVRRCKEYHWQPGDVIPVEATMYRHITITLPEEGMDVVLGEKELWDMDWSKNIIFAKSLTPLPQGRIGAITAVGRSGNTYEFEVHRVDRPSVQCVTVKADGSMINHTAWQTGDAQQGAQAQAREQALTAQIARLNVEKAELAKDGDRKAREALKMYRTAINTNYKWSNAEGWYAAGGDIVESVHDDGRFTYVRLKSDNRGLMTIQAEIDGKKEILESTYDANTRTHKINGIFPKFVMRAGESELTITREGA